jgi:hypothetical protein
LIVDGGEEASHIKSEVDHGVVVSHGVHRSEINALLSRIRGHMCSDLFQQMEDLATAKVCWRSPLLRPRTAEENLRKEVVMNSVPTESLSALSLKELNRQIRVPDLFP